MWWGRLSSFWPRLLVDVSFLLRPPPVSFGLGGIVPPLLLLVRSPGDYLAYGAVLALLGARPLQARDCRLPYARLGDGALGVSRGASCQR